MSHRVISLSLCLLALAVPGCAAHGEKTSVPADPELREQLADYKARAQARALIAKGWEDWNWQTHNATWEGDVLIVRDGFNPPVRINVPQADAVRIRKFGDRWYYEVRVHITRPEPFTIFLRADNADAAQALVDALTLLGAKEG